MLFQRLSYLFLFFGLSLTHLHAVVLHPEDEGEEEKKTRESVDLPIGISRPLPGEQEDRSKMQLYSRHIAGNPQEDPSLSHQSQTIGFQRALSSLPRDVDSMHLINLKATTVYDYFSSDFLRETQGYLLAPWQVSSVFKPFFGTLFYDLESREIIKQETIWRWLIQYLELPDMRLSGPAQKLQEAYIAQTDQLIRAFTDRIEEDVFCLATLCGMLSVYNANPRNVDQLPLTFAPIPFEDKDLFSSKGLELMEGEKVKRYIDLDSLSETFLETLLKPYKMTIDQEHLQAFSSGGPIEVLKRVLASVKYGHYYSWMADRSLLVQTKKKLDFRKDVSQEILQGFYNVMGRLINKEALLVIKGSLTSKREEV